MGDEVVGDGVALQEDYDAADFSSAEEEPGTDNKDSLAANFTDTE